jgi:hypothetical protein
LTTLSITKTDLCKSADQLSFNEFATGVHSRAKATMAGYNCPEDRSHITKCATIFDAE